MKTFIKIGIIVLVAAILVCGGHYIWYINQDEEVDPSILANEALGYIHPIFKDILDMKTTTITITKENYSIDKDNNAGEKVITKSTYDDEKKLYLNRVVQDNRSEFNYLTYLNNSTSYYIWGSKAGTDGLIVDESYIKNLVRDDILSSYTLIEQYKNYDYSAFTALADKNENDFKNALIDDGFEVSSIDFSVTFTKENSAYTIFYVEKYSASKSSQTFDNEVSLAITFDNTKLLSSKLSEIESISNLDNENISYNHDVCDVSYKYEYDKAFYNTVNRPTKMPTAKAKTKYTFYQDGEILESDYFQYGTNYATRFGNLPIYNYVNRQHIYTDETYLQKNPIVDRVNGYAKSYEDSNFYGIKMPGENKAKIIVVYLYQDGDKIEHRGTEYFMSNVGRFEINTEFNDVKYNDKIDINGVEHKYESFGLLQGNVYIVHCYDIR